MKKDIKYIIKRIIIGVAIALILGFLHKNHVFAEENTTATCFGSNMTVETCNSSSEEHIFIDTFSGQLKIGSRLYNSALYNNIFSFKNSNNDYLVIDDSVAKTSLNKKNIKQFGFIEQKVNNQNTYSVLYSKDIENINSSNFSNNNVISGSGRFMFISQDLTRRDNFYQNYISLNNTSSSNYFRGKITHNGEDYYIFMSYYAYDKYYINPTEWTYLTSTDNFPNLDNSKLYYINENFKITDELPEQIYDIPSYYQKIDFTNYDAVFFVPKDYTEVSSSINNSQEVINFNMYYSGTMRQSYFNLYDVNDWYFEENDLFSINLTNYQTSFPMHFKNNTNITEDLTAIMFSKTLESNNTIIYFDSRYFNYFLVDNLNNYQTDVSFINDNNEETIIWLVFDNLVENNWIKGFESGGEDFNNNSCSNGGICSDNIQSFLNLLTLPINWLKSLNKNNCQAIVLPIPFINNNITINCLSSTFKSVLGENFYNIILYIISGLIAYRVTIRNIDTINDILDPNDDKLEVIDL